MNKKFRICVKECQTSVLSIASATYEVSVSVGNNFKAEDTRNCSPHCFDFNFKTVTLVAAKGIGQVH